MPEVFNSLIRVMKSRIIRWTRHVACIVDRKVRTWFWCEKLREGFCFEDLHVDGKIILRWIFRVWDGVHGLE
jgi:hypothetical protein